VLHRDLPLLRPSLERTLELVDHVAAEQVTSLRLREIGEVLAVGHGTARLTGLPGVRSEELVAFPDGVLGMAFNLDEDEVGVILLGESASLHAGAEARRTGRVVDVPVGHGALGRTIDPTGRPLDGRGPLQGTVRWPIERDAPPIMDRAPVVVPLQTGLKVVDALIPIGRGQRELILGDRQTGKSAIALDTILNQREEGVLCVYCAIGQRTAAVARFIEELRRGGAMDYTTVVVAPGQSSPGLQFIAPYAATSIAEYFMAEGDDVLIVYDDLTRHAQAYRELSLLLRRPPGREAFPGDIFYVHSRLLERSTHLRPELGGGSLTALPIIETEAQNLAAYIPTNLISITDGQIYLSPQRFQKGVLPAVDVGTSVSRVGGKAQLPAYRGIAGELRLAYTQFEELEAFSRFGARLDEDTVRVLERGRRVREVLRQAQYRPLPAADQIVVLLALTSGLYDRLPLDRIAEGQEVVRAAVRSRVPDRWRALSLGEPLDEVTRETLLACARAALVAGFGEAGFDEAGVGGDGTGGNGVGGDDGDGDGDA
jgi:F-type H+/Na+-transporting ATPase subunit alpha